MGQRNRDRAYWQEKLAELKTLRDDHQVVTDGLELAYQYLSSVEERLPELDIPQSEFAQLSTEKQLNILHERKRVIQSICDYVVVHDNGKMEIGALISDEQSKLFSRDQGNTGTSMDRVS